MSNGRKNKLLFITIFSVFCLLCLPVFVDAARTIQDAAPLLDSVSQKAGVEQVDVGVLAIRIIQAAISITGLSFMILMVYGGFVWMTARGEESRVDQAKTTIKSALIGIIIVVSAYVVTTFVLDAILPTESTNTQNQLQ